MELIDVSCTVRPDPQGRRWMMDPETGERFWVGNTPEPTAVEPMAEPEPKPAKKKRLFHG